jgi:hypothetical protein
MVYDREDDEARRADQQARSFPELPLGIEAFRSPLNTLPSDVPAPKHSQQARNMYFIVASLAVGLGVFAAVALHEPSPTLTEAREDRVATPAPAPVKSRDASRVVQAGVLSPVQALGAHAVPPKPSATPKRSVVRDDVTRTASTRRAKRRNPQRKPAPAARERAASRKLPAHPSRSAVLAAMRSVTPAARSCLSGSAVAQAHITFKGETGKVMGASVKGVAGAAASCVASAVRAAKVPPFSKPQLEITFPFRAGG